MCKIWKKYFEGLYSVRTEEWVTVIRCGFNLTKISYFGRWLESEMEEEVKAES